MDHPALDVFGTVGRFLDNKARKLGVPIHGTFELTPLCNLNCKMCYVHLSASQLGKRKLLSVDQWKSLMGQAVDEGMMDAVLTGGECLTYPGFVELYLFLEEMGVRSAILTNGLLLTEDRIQFFKEHPPKGIQITLYGCNENEYEAVTGRRCFQQVLKNLQILAETGIPYTVAITPNRYMQDYGEGLIKLSHQLGIPFSVNTSLFRPREDTGRRDVVDDLDVNEYIALHLLRKQLSDQPVSANTECVLPLPASSGKPTTGLLCSAGNSSFCITWDGRMLPCSSFDDCEAFPLEEGFRGAWQRTHAFSVNFPLPEECGDCPYNHICPSCVMVHRQDAPLGHASKRVCDRAKMLVRHGLAKLRD